MNKAHSKTGTFHFDSRRCFWDCHDGANAAHFCSKHLPSGFHLLVKMNSLLIFITYYWFNQTINGEINALFSWKSSAEQLKGTERRSAETSERSTWFRAQSQGQGSTTGFRGRTHPKLCSHHWWELWRSWGVSTSVIQQLPQQGVKVVDLLRSGSSKWFWGHQGSGQCGIQPWNKHLNQISPFITLMRSKIHQQVTNQRTSVVFVPECQAGWNQLQGLNN